jgi:hypothetical protein
MRNTFLGINEVKWFIGVVEDTNDPLQQGRVRVRIHGLHTKDPLELKTSDLPWSPILLPTNMGGFQGSGYSASGALAGATVMGILLDAIAAQYSIVLGVLMGNNAADANVPPGPYNNVDKNQDLPKLKQDPCEGLNYLQSKGYSREQAAAILGNLVQESGLNTNAVGDSGTAYGLAQWRGPRQAALRQYAASQGTDPSDYATQLAFIDVELNGSEKKAGAAFKNTASLEDAVNVFSSKYERPSAKWAANDKRLAAAQQILNKCSV